MDTDRAKFVGMLAVGNFRYSVTVHNEGCTVSVNGKRDEAPGTASNIAFGFNADGNLDSIKVEWK
jgi:hypothetical protein